jgi:hypothetical protein
MPLSLNVLKFLNIWKDHQDVGVYLLYDMSYYIDDMSNFQSY